MFGLLTVNLRDGGRVVVREQERYGGWWGVELNPQTLLKLVAINDEVSRKATARAMFSFVSTYCIQ